MLGLTLTSFCILKQMQTQTHQMQTFFAGFSQYAFDMKAL